MEHEAELQRLREENADLKKRINDFSNVETAKKKAEARIEQLEQKVLCILHVVILNVHLRYDTDGQLNSREGFSESQWTNGNLRWENQELWRSVSFSICLCSSALNIYSLLSREQDLQRQLSLTKNQLRDLRASNETNQAKLIDHSQKQGQIYI